MTLDVAQILFIIVGGLTLVAGFLVVTTRNIVHASLWLTLTLFGVTVVFVILGANFFAGVQVLVYIGAISILIIFAIMLTRRVMTDTGPQTNANWWVPALISVVTFGGLTYLFVSTPWADRPAVDLSGNITQLGTALVSAGPNGYIVPFEMVSVMLVLALIGAIAVALPPQQPKKTKRTRIEPRRVSGADAPDAAKE